jgi:hypothetical protein
LTVCFLKLGIADFAIDGSTLFGPAGLCGRQSRTSQVTLSA